MICNDYIGPNKILEKVRPFFSRNQSKLAISNHSPTTRSCASFHGASSDESDGEDLGIARQNSENMAKSQRMDTDEEDEKLGRWNSQIVWLSNVLESAMSWYKQTVRPGMQL